MSTPSPARRRTLRALLLTALSLAPLALPGVPANPVVADVPEVVNLTVDAAPGFPADAVVRHPARLPLEVHVEGPGGVAPPGEVRFNGTGDLGATVTFTPNPLTLEPGRTRYLVTATYAPPRTGHRVVNVTATGPLGAEEGALLHLPAVQDVVTLRVTDPPGATTSRWRVPFTLDANLTRLPQEPVHIRLRARFAGAEPSAAWVEPGPNVTLTRNAAEVSVEFTARHGAGRYQVVAEAVGERAGGASEPLLLDVSPPAPGQSSATVHAVVEDAPTTVEFTSDSVNSDGKSKYPGQELVTRVRVADANGLGDVDAVVFTYRRLTPGAPAEVVHVSRHPVDEAAWPLTEAEVEDRFGWRPLKDGAYDAVVSVEGATAGPVARTFVVRDVLPTLHDATLASTPVVATGNLTLSGVVQVADRNLGGGPTGGAVAELGVLTSTVYRGSRSTSDAVATFDGEAALNLTTIRSDNATYRYDVWDGDGVLSVPLRVHVAADAPAGDYRVAVDHTVDGRTRRLGSVPFTLLPPPRVTEVLMTPGDPSPGGTVHLRSTLEAREPDNVTVSYALLARDGDGPWTTLAEAQGTAAGVHLSLPAATPLEWEYAARAQVVLPDGSLGEAATRSWSPAPEAPTILQAAVLVDGTPTPLDPLRVVPGAVGALGVEAALRTPHGSPPDVSGQLTDWTGERVGEVACGVSPGGNASRHSASCTLPVPADLVAGRYTLALHVEGAGGASTWERSVDAAPWLHLELVGDINLRAGEDGVLEGVVALSNRGNVAVDHATLRLTPFQGETGEWVPAGGGVSAAIGGGVVDASWQGGVAVLEATGGPLLAPGQDAQLHVTVVPPRGASPGDYAAELSVVAGVAQ